MTAQDVIAGAKGKPVPFEFDGFSCLLRPLTYGERNELFAWRERNDPKLGEELPRWLLTRAVCDESGRPILAPGDLDGFDLRVVDAVANAVLLRAGIGGDSGKA